MLLFQSAKKITAHILLFVILGFTPFAVFCQERSLRINFIDVGEGEAILIETPESKNILVDSGNIISGFSVLEYLKSKNIHRLDYFILTHPHLDHIGGAFFLLQALDVESICDNGQDLSGVSKSKDIYRYYNKLVRNNEKYSNLKAGDKIEVGGVSLGIKWPVEPPVLADFNVNSLVIMLEYNDFCCLLAGDLTIAGEKELLSIGNNLKAEVFKIGHHGSKDANSKEFLKEVSPSVSIISIDKHNRRGYPSKQVLNRLKKIGSKIYKTAEFGNITISVNKDGSYSIKTSKGLR